MGKRTRVPSSRVGLGARWPRLNGAGLPGGGAGLEIGLTGDAFGFEEEEVIDAWLERFGFQSWGGWFHAGEGLSVDEELGGFGLAVGDEMPESVGILVGGHIFG